MRLAGAMCGEKLFLREADGSPRNLTRDISQEVGVATRREVHFLLTLPLIAALAACNSGSTLKVQNPPPPPANEISIAFQPAPPASLAVNAVTPITAVVTNDTTNGGSGSGVDWVISCQGGNCGSLSAPHTSSGQATTYTPPAALAGNAEIINIQAFATADQSKNVLASVNITAFGNNLMGTYVLQAHGIEGGLPYQYAGVIVLDGNGNITSGQQTVNFSDPNTGIFISDAETVNPVGSSYFLGPDGRGTITINPNNPTNDPSIVPQTFSLAFLSNSQCLITVTPTPTITVTAAGTMDLQASSITPPTGGYAFVVSGTDAFGAGFTGMGGILNIDNVMNNPNNISGAGSIANQALVGFPTVGLMPTGIVTFPSSLGVVTISLSMPTFSNPNPQFTGYIIDSTHIALIESDNGGAGATAGIALGQGSATGSFLDDSAFSGPYVFGVLGTDPSSPFALPETLTSVGVVSADGAGNLTNGYTDTSFQSLFSPVTGLPAQISGTFSGTYTVTSPGTGRVQAYLGGFTYPNNSYHATYIFYLTGNGNPALVLAVGETSFPFLGTGIAYPQSASAPTFSGSYGLSFTQQLGPVEFDGTGEMTVASPALSGAADVGPTVDQGFSGTFSSQNCSGVTGCFPGSFSNAAGNSGSSSAFQGNNVSNPNAPVAFNADFYMIDSSHGFFAETDLLTQEQVTFGYFATSTPPQPAAAGDRLKRPRP